MKKLLTLVACLGLAIAPVILTTGCGSPTPQAVAYKTLKITKATVDAAVDSFIDYDITHGVKLEDRQKVAKLNDQFNEGFIIAVRAAALDYNAITPENVKVLADSVVSFIVQITTKK